MQQWQQFLDTIPSFPIAVGIIWRYHSPGETSMPDANSRTFTMEIKADILCRPRGLWMQMVWSRFW